MNEIFKELGMTRECPLTFFVKSVNHVEYRITLHKANNGNLQARSRSFQIIAYNCTSWRKKNFVTLVLLYLPYCLGEICVFVTIAMGMSNCIEQNILYKIRETCLSYFSSHSY